METKETIKEILQTRLGTGHWWWLRNTKHNRSLLADCFIAQWDKADQIVDQAKGSKISFLTLIRAIDKDTYDALDHHRWRATPTYEVFTRDWNRNSF